MNDRILSEQIILSFYEHLLGKKKVPRPWRNTCGMCGLFMFLQERGR